MIPKGQMIYSIADIPMWLSASLIEIHVQEAVFVALVSNGPAFQIGHLIRVNMNWALDRQHDL